MAWSKRLEIINEDPIELSLIGVVEFEGPELQWRMHLDISQVCIR
jgi:hypothetical protein